tara:strand:+ start:226 stop:450 length:225 start_codon:yes stop_codon:yes gene_type:complete
MDGAQSVRGVQLQQSRLGEVSSLAKRVVHSKHIGLDERCSATLLGLGKKGVRYLNTKTGHFGKTFRMYSRAGLF